MAFNNTDIKEYTDNAPPYIDGFIFVQGGLYAEDEKCLDRKLRRLCDDYEGLSFLLIISTHESKGNIVKVKIKTGKPGRPKTVVEGKVVEKHCHGLLINENPDTDIDDVREELNKYFKKRRAKRPNLKQQKTKEVWQNNLSIVKYMDRQSDNTHTYGGFDFDYFRNPYYMPDPPTNYVDILDFE